MKTDKNLTQFLTHIQSLRIYDDDKSILMRARMIQELSDQIKSIMIMRD